MRNTWTGLEDTPVNPRGIKVEEEQAKYLQQGVGWYLFKMIEEEEKQMKYNKVRLDDLYIHRVIPYETQWENLLWKAKEKSSIMGAIAGAIVTNIFWLIVVYF